MTRKKAELESPDSKPHVPLNIDWDRISTVMAFDYGGRRIGVAIGNTQIESANPLTTLGNTDDGPDWIGLRKLMVEWQPDLIIVGLPVLLDGSASANSAAVEEFAGHCQSLFEKPVILVDEKLTSVEAKEQIKSSRQAGLRRRTKPGDVDKFAAQVILRSWLNERGERRPRTL